MKHTLLIFLLMITFNANSIAGGIMVPNMGTTDMIMSHDCHNDMSSSMANMDMSDHCESGDQQHETCDSENCGACVYHCSSAVFTRLTTPVVDELPLLEIHYQQGDTHSLHARLLRPPKTA